ncbi:MAG: response regulator [Candidatus Pacebacteria bacterium]|nr:response regulator [Candidatus Paceibacterota bacterium]
MGQNQQEKISQTADPAVSSVSAKTILLVEDDLPMVKMYSTKFKTEGFNVETAYDGEEGLVKLAEKKIDLVVLDLMIPKIGGMDVLEKVRTNERLNKIPVIILSNLSQDQDIKKAKELGVQHFLIKSNYTPSQVVAFVKSYFPS